MTALTRAGTPSRDDYADARYVMQEVSPMECCVGLDVHSEPSVFVIQDGRGQVMAQGELPTTPEGFRRWDDAPHLPAGTLVALEAGTVAFFVAQELRLCPENLGHCRA